MPRRARRVFGYARVSSIQQTAGTSLQDQQASIRAYAKRERLKVDRMFVEAESGIHEKAERREQLQALLATVSDGDLVLCAKLDRWSRDTEHTLTTVRELSEQGVSFYAVDDNCDPATRDGHMMLTLRAMMAREEHARIRERMVGTRQILRDKGLYVEGLPPLGYVRATKQTLAVDPDGARLVRRIFGLYLGGKSMTQVAEVLDLKLDRVKDAIHRRLYTGQIQDSKGEWIRGQHPAIIDADTFERAQELSSKRRYHPVTPQGLTSGWVLRDVARCIQCGAKMSAAYGGSPDARRFYYRCSARCGVPYVPVAATEAQVGPMVVARLAELRELLGQEPKPEKRRTVTNTAAKRERLQQKRGRYLEAFSDGLMSRDELRERLGKVDADLLKLEAQDARQRRPVVSPRARVAALKSVAMLARAWENGTPRQQRELVTRLAEAVGVGAGKPPKPQWRPESDLLAEVH